MSDLFLKNNPANMPALHPIAENTAISRKVLLRIESILRCLSVREGVSVVDSADIIDVY